LIKHFSPLTAGPVDCLLQAVHARLLLQPLDHRLADAVQRRLDGLVEADKVVAKQFADLLKKWWVEFWNLKSTYFN
jgi:hypothetical protein